MSVTRPSPLAKPGELPTAQLAKAALRRLAIERLEPTPENYERAFRHEAGEAADSTEALATLIERIIRGIERGGHNWTPARRKEGIQRVLSAGRGDPRRLQQRLSQLVNSWESDTAATSVAVVDSPAAPPTVTRPAPLDAANESEATHAPAAEAPAATVAATVALAWERVARTFGEALQQALPAHEGANRDLSSELAQLLARMQGEGATPSLADATEALAQRAQRVLQHRHHLFDQLGKLCGELTASLTDLAEDGSWVKGQCEAMQAKIDEGLSARGVRAVSDMLHHARRSSTARCAASARRHATRSRR